MAIKRAFRNYAKGQEKEIIEFIETHTVWEAEEKFGYRWFTIKPWYDDHKSKDPLSLLDSNTPGHITPIEQLANAIFTKYEQLQKQNAQYKALWEESQREVQYLKQLVKDRDRAELGVMREIYGYCKA